MARIGTWELSEAAVKAALEAIGLMRSDALLIFKGMVKGGMTKPESIRKYLKQVSSAPGNVQIPDALVEILLRSSKCSGVIALLSDQAIAGNRGAICGCFGVGHYELSLALTGRIQNLRLLLSNADGEANAKGTPSDCADVLAQAVCGPILNCLGFTLSPGQVLGPGDSASEVPKGASNGTESVAKDEKESAKLRKKLEALNLESQKSRLELKDAKANSQKLEFELKKATEQITKLKEAHAAEVAAAVEQQVSAIARPWLEEPLAFESMASGFAEDFESVTLLAEKVLKEQTERDRHTGNKLVVEGQLKRLSELRDRLAEAGKSALRPHPDLPKVIAQVEIRIKRHRQLLGEEAQLSDDRVREGLVTHLNAAKNEAEVEKVSKLADDLERFGILNTFDKIAVVKARDRKCSMLAESKLPVAQKDTASALRAALALNLKISLVVDGYNVLHLLPEVFGQAYEDGIPRKEARDSMIEKMKRGLENHPNTQCLLFFDGPREKSEAVAKNLTIAYSGGAAGTKNRADDAIIKHLKHVGEDEPKLAKYIITKDVGLQQRAGLLNCHAVDVASFAAILDW